MKKQKKTYGIKGFMEYQAVIKVGSSKMKVPFTDGSVSAMGVNPATFTTDKFMVQHAIENSSEFKRGLIHIVSTIDLGEEIVIERNVGKALPHPEEMQPEQEEGKDMEQEKEEVVAEIWPAKDDDSEEMMIQVEFTSNDEAKDYLEQNFGLVRSKLRNRDDITKAGNANGVDIIFV